MGGQKVEIWDFAKTDHGARLVNTFYPTNGPQTSKSAEFVSMNPPNNLPDTTQSATRITDAGRPHVPERAFVRLSGSLRT